jgi:hypothetical protein
VVGGSGASASRPCSVVESGAVPRRCRWVNDPLLPGLRSSSRSFAAAGDPVSHRRRPTRARRVAPAGVSHRESSVAHPDLPPKRGWGAGPCRSTSRTGTTLEELVPGATVAHDPKTAAIGGQGVAAQPKLHRRGTSRPGRLAEARRRNPIASKSLRGFIARGVHHTAACFPSPGGRRDSQANLGTFDAFEVCPELKFARGGPTRVSPKRPGDPRRPS